jgi:hypothetical protein
MTDAIKPPWAFSVWCSSDSIFAELPPINGHQSHTVKVTNDIIGLKKLLVLAKSRDENTRFATKSDPTQHQIEKVSYDPSMVRRAPGKIKFTAQQRIDARVILRKMGLI